MSDHYFFLLGVLGHVFPIEVDCVCCLLVEYSRAANVTHHHIVNIFSIITTKTTFYIWITLPARRIFACCKYQRSPMSISSQSPPPRSHFIFGVLCFVTERVPLPIDVLGELKNTRVIFLACVVKWEEISECEYAEYLIL